MLAPNQIIMYQARVAGLAQLVEHLICNQRVGSSSLSTGTTFPLQFMRFDLLAGPVFARRSACQMSILFGTG